jgi:hypothetical protein
MAKTSTSPYTLAWMARARTTLTRSTAVEAPGRLTGVFHPQDGFDKATKLDRKFPEPPVGVLGCVRELVWVLL